jgi:predicted alpha/beta-fold hydrolase
MVAVGYSLGGAMLLKYLGEEGSFSPLARRGDDLRPDRSGLRTSRHMSRTRNWLYHAYLLNDMKAEALAPKARSTLPEEREDHQGGAQRLRIR